MADPSTPFISPRTPLPASLKVLRQARGVSLVELARVTGLNRVTLAAAEGAADTRLSTLATAFGALDYVLMPVPRALAQEVAAFVANGGAVVGAPAGVNAPVNAALGLFQQRPLRAQEPEARYAAGHAVPASRGNDTGIGTGSDPGADPFEASDQAGDT